MISASALAQCSKAQGNGSGVRAPSRSGLHFPVRAGKRHAADVPSRSSMAGRAGPAIAHFARVPAWSSPPPGSCGTPFRSYRKRQASAPVVPAGSCRRPRRCRRAGQSPAGAPARKPAVPWARRRPGRARIKPPAALRGRARSCMRAAADAVSPARRTPDGSGCRPRRRCTAPRPRCGCRRRDGRSRPAPSSRWRRCRPSSLRPAACR